MEAHLKQLKKQHASQLQGMQSLLDNQSDQIDSLLADQQSLKTQCTQSKCEADAATGQLNSVKQKLTSVKQEADAERQEKMQLQASVHELQQASHKTTQAMAAAADRESNLHQQIHTLKSQLADTSKEQELQGLHDQLELKDQELARLQAQVQAGMWSYVLSAHAAACYTGHVDCFVVFLS